MLTVLKGRDWASVFVGFSFHRRRVPATTLDLLTSLKRRRLRRPSPHHRVTAPFRQWLIVRQTEHSDGVELHRCWLGLCFFRRRHVSPTTWLVDNRMFDPPGIRNPRRFNEGRCLAYVVGLSAVSRSLFPWPLRAETFFRTSRWPRPGCIPPLKVAEFEGRVLHGYGPAQVGIGDCVTTLLSSPHRLFCGKLSP